MVDSKKGKLSARLESGQMTAQQAAVMALNHPLRVTLLTILTERPASPSQLEDAGVENLSNISYRCRVLHELRQIRIVEEIPRRGADWEKFGPKVRRAISAYGVDEIFKDVQAALTSGTFDASTKRHLSRVRLDLDHQGWLEANAVQNEALVRLMEIAEEAGERMEESGEVPIPSISAMACFQMPPAEADGDPGD